MHHCYPQCNIFLFVFNVVFNIFSAVVPAGAVPFSGGYVQHVTPHAASWRDDGGKHGRRGSDVRYTGRHENAHNATAADPTCEGDEYSVIGI